MRVPARVLTLIGVLFLSVACANRALYVRPGVDPSCADCAAAGDQLDARVILIGDTGEYESVRPALAALEALAAEDPGRTVALFLGDNIYPRGLPAADEPVVPDDEEPEMARRILQQQVEAVDRAGIRSVFVPGNHDWDRSGVRGLERLQAQSDYLDENSTHAVMYPRAGCPGPTVLDVGSRLRILVVDTEWLVRSELPKLTDCEWGAVDSPVSLAANDNATVYAAIRQAIADAGDRRVLMATHHPLKTLGSHGGRYATKDYIFPLTHLASWLYLPVPLLYPPLRTWVRRSDQDLSGGGNRAMVAALQAELSTAAASPLVASGHEHSLQVFDDPEDPIWYLVSGSAAKTEPTGHGDDTVFKQVDPGLMVLDVHADGRIALRVLETTGTPGGKQTFAGWLEDRVAGGE